jgi:tetratricopeptide (TPR) repeat protein
MKERDQKPQNISENIDKILEKAEYYSGFNQDSSIWFYENAIDTARLIHLEKESFHYIGLCFVGMAAVNCNMGNYTASGQNVAKALEIAEIKNDLDIMSRAYNVKGLLFYNQSNFDSASFYYDKALLLLNKTGNKALEAKIHTNKAIINYFQGKSDEAIASFGRTLSIAEEINDTDLIIGTYINMGLVAQNFGEYQKSIDFNQKAIEGYKKINGKDGLVLCYQNLGSLYLLLGEYAKSLDLYNQSLQMAEEIGDKSNIAKAHHNIAEAYSRLGDFEQSVQEYLMSIRQKEALNDKSTLADGYNGLGTLYFQQGIYEKALEYYQKAMIIFEEMKFPKGQANTLASMASIFAAQHDFNKALHYYLKAIETYKKLNASSPMADQFINMGAIYSKLKQFELAEEYLLKALKMKTELTEKEGIAMVNLELANLKFEEAKIASTDSKNTILNQAVNFGLKSYNLAKELKVLPLQNSASSSLKKIYNELGNENQALKFSDIFISTNDSLFNKSKAEALTYAEARWSVEKHQSKINNLENEKKLQNEILKRKEKEGQQQKTIIYFGILLLIVLVASVVLITINNQRKRELSQQKQLNSLTVLKMQNIANRMSPHFIFNMLGSISDSVDKPEVAKNKINNLAMMLRNVIENIEHIAIPLEKELSIVEEFVELQKDKIATPFRFEIQIDPEINRQILVPAMIVQIPVENAIKHGLAHKENGPNEMKIRIEKSGSGSLISVIDNGIGLKNQKGKSEGSGSGLKMVMQTIQLLNAKNKNSITFSVNERLDGNQGTNVEIIIPGEYSFQI